MDDRNTDEHLNGHINNVPYNSCDALDSSWVCVDLAAMVVVHHFLLPCCKQLSWLCHVQLARKMINVRQYNMLCVCRGLAKFVKHMLPIVIILVIICI